MTNMTNYYLFFLLKLLFDSELYITFQVIIHYNYCVFDEILLTTYKRIQQVDAKIQSFHVSDLKISINGIIIYVNFSFFGSFLFPSQNLYFLIFYE